MQIHLKLDNLVNKNKDLYLKILEGNNKLTDKIESFYLTKKDEWGIIYKEPSPIIEPTPLSESDTYKEIFSYS